MENISLVSKTNFFKKYIGNYQKASVMANTKKYNIMEGISTIEVPKISSNFSFNKDF